LRAIAVLLVIATHAGYVPGGYLGVDVFFALSGYLITTIIIRERREGLWSLKGFYVRRARRLYPALLVLLLITLPFGWLLVPAGRHYATAAALTGVYLSDFVNHEALGALAHTWSLAVEEQFYLGWPLILAFALRRMRPNTTIIVTLSCAAGALLTMATQPGPAIVLPTGRGGTLLLGCALALILDRHRVPRAPLVATLSSLGLAVTVAVANLGHSAGISAAIAGIMATGVIAGIVHGGMLARVLSVQPLVWLGKRSYGVYLWHGVIVYVVGHRAFVHSHGSLRVLLPSLIGGIGLAAVSYRLIETRFRRPDRTAPYAAAAAVEAA
jgi:peptidoglycan/LPS O-acetylase OafA/YrhL